MTPVVVVIFFYARDDHKCVGFRQAPTDKRVFPAESLSSNREERISFMENTAIIQTGITLPVSEKLINDVMAAVDDPTSSQILSSDPLALTVLLKELFRRATMDQVILQELAYLETEELQDLLTNN